MEDDAQQREQPAGRDPWSEPAEAAPPSPPRQPFAPVWLRFAVAGVLVIGALLGAGWGLTVLTARVVSPPAPVETSPVTPTAPPAVAPVTADPPGPPRAVAPPGRQAWEDAMSRVASPLFDELAPPASPPPLTVVPSKAAAQRAAARHLLTRVDQVQGRLQVLAELGEAWREEVEPLTRDDPDGAGRRLAASESAVRLFAANDLGKRFEPALHEGLAAALREVREPLDAVLLDRTAVLGDRKAVEAQLTKLESGVESEVAQWRQAHTMVRALREETEDLSPAGRSLPQAVERLLAADARRRAALVAERVAAAEEELSEELAESQVQLREIEARRKLAEEAVEQEQRLAEVAKLEANRLALADRAAVERQRAQLERKFQADLPEVQRTLVPFITPGHKQLNGSDWVYIEEPAPLSLSGVKASGALRDDEMSFQALYYIAGGRPNDRANGPFQHYIGGHIRDAMMPLVKKTQSLLTEYGELMVEKGMLAP